MLKNYSLKRKIMTYVINLIISLSRRVRNFIFTVRINIIQINTPGYWTQFIKRKDLF